MIQKIDTLIDKNLDERLEEKKLRVPFVYPIKDRFWDRIKITLNCCCSSFRCCAISKKGERFNKAVSMLYAEMDVLSLIQN